MSTMTTRTTTGNYLAENEGEVIGIALFKGNVITAVTRQPNGKYVTIETQTEAGLYEYHYRQVNRQIKVVDL